MLFEDGGTSGQQRWPLLVAVGVAVTAVVALGVVLLNRPAPAPAPEPEVGLPSTAPSQDPAGPAETQTPSAQPTASPTTSGAPTGEGPEVPAALLAELQFQRLAGVRIPTHPTAGPSDQESGRASGWERSELGAVLAAFGLSMRSAETVGPAVFRPTIQDQFTGSPGEIESTLAGVERRYEEARLAQGLSDGEPLREPLFSYLGWSLDRYDDTNAEVRLLGEGPGPDGQPLQATFRTPLRWENGDWRYVAPPEGSFNSRIQQQFDSTQFTLFEEVG